MAPEEPGRPPFILLPATLMGEIRDVSYRVHMSSVTDELVVTPLFVMVPLSGDFQSGETFRRRVVLTY